MKTNYISAIVMLLAGAVYCLFALMAQVPLMEFTIQLLIVLIIFYVLGGIIRMVLDRFMGEIEVKSDEEVEDASEDENEETQSESTDASDSEEGM